MDPVSVQVAPKMSDVIAIIFHIGDVIPRAISQKIMPHDTADNPIIMVATWHL